MKSRIVGCTLLLLILVSIGAMAAGNDKAQYDPSQKEFYLSEADLAFLRPGLNVDIQDVEVSGTTVIVTFKVTDGGTQGDPQPLDIEGNETPGVVETHFILARINPGDTQYSSYTKRQIGGSERPFSDFPEGSYESLGNGVYKYTFATQLPAGYPANATHTVGVYAARDLRPIAEELGLSQLAKTGYYISNDTFNFVPSGGAVTQVREIVSTGACNQCHDPLTMHRRLQEVGDCILCHQPENEGADFKVMIHKIHDGANLPSVQSGTPYTLFGHDFSDVEWPQDVRNCTTCHQGASQADHYKTNPNRAACGSCHDDVNFATGEHHGGGIQTDDSQCSICHPADGQEFDLSVTGVHTIPDFSKQLKGLNVEITGITNTSPGSKPTVTFTLKDNDGNPLDISSALDSLNLRLAGPTTDYTWTASESALSATATSSGYSYTFQNTTIPADAKGSYAVGAEFYKGDVPLTGPLPYQEPVAHLETGFNPVSYFSVDGSAVQDRREIVNVNTRCNVCHKRLQLHHGNRLNTSFCVFCHNPATTDNPDGSRDRGFDVPEGTLPTSINFRFMIHRIHTGHDLERDFTVYRTRGVYNFNEIHFPGDRRDCAKCHVDDSYELPLPSTNAETVAPREFYSPLGPAASACLGCHDGEDAAAHAFLQTAAFPSGKSSESCAVCHEEGADFAVSKVHAR